MNLPPAKNSSLAPKDSDTATPDVPSNLVQPKISSDTAAPPRHKRASITSGKSTSTVFKQLAERRKEKSTNSNHPLETVEEPRQAAAGNGDTLPQHTASPSSVKSSVDCASKDDPGSGGVSGIASRIEGNIKFMQHPPAKFTPSGSGSGDGNPGPPLESPTLVGLTKSRPVTERRRRPTDNERHSLHLASMKRPLVQSASFEEYDPSQRSSESAKDALKESKHLIDLVAPLHSPQSEPIGSTSTTNDPPPPPPPVRSTSPAPAPRKTTATNPLALMASRPPPPAPPNKPENKSDPRVPPTAPPPVPSEPPPGPPQNVPAGDVLQPPQRRRSGSGVAPPPPSIRPPPPPAPPARLRTSTSPSPPSPSPDLGSTNGNPSEGRPLSLQHEHPLSPDTKSKNAAYFKQMKEEEEKKARDQLDKLTPEEREARIAEEEAAKMHENSKVSHFSKLGKTFSQTSKVLSGGRGGRGGRGIGGRK
eukprot:CAMPEP_0185031270 /NCGR_PEP_ID=MMETSP1103-20130426/18650_1 /TAXON_ID=36769 /ORGANISM="Paraphysomonas bandaiensis, Strain Caron Lab Isolate" /LENGTH=475 /DNA_ID=CAMNT_0027566745 /DNA_START=447 /DNA_END=1874 /DNA_ORIENTATION=-